ncbi:MAG: zinc protease [Oceanicoccus sp.]|jgi:zinc protease
MLKYWAIAFTATLLTACGGLSKEAANGIVSSSVTGGITFVEEVRAVPGKTIISYKKYELDNGLTLILHEDNSDPLVHVDVTYHVGSARESIGKSGFAHFFEHMMFQGSDNVADEQHFKLVTEAGGRMNGTTSSDRTNYFQTVPVNQLEKMLWLESDRMGYFVDSVTQEKFEVQRETVKNERGQRVDNRPYGRFNERVAAALYPEGHPYSWPVIGFMEDLNRVNVNDLKAFFLRWYGPNNATLTIGGDVDVTQTLKLVAKYFGPIPRGPEVDMPQKREITLDGDRYISMEDNVNLPLLYMSFPTVNVRHADEAPLDLLSTILGGGKTSLLYKNLVKNQIAVQASVSHPCAELACTFNLMALPHPESGTSMAQIETIIRETLVEFESRGVENDDLIKAKAQMEAGFVFGLQSVSGKVSQLAYNQTFKGNPNYIEQDIERYANVTKEDVIRVFNQYVKGKYAVIMSIVPDGKLEMVAAKDNYIVPRRTIPADLPQNTMDKLLVRTAQDNFDRSIIPVAAANKPVDVPAMWQDALDNGMRVLGTQSLETPTTSILIKIPAGHYFETVDKSGTASILATMLNESTMLRSAEDMSKELQKLGSSISISSGYSYLTISINTLTKNLDATIALLAEKILQPALLEDEFVRVRSNAIQVIKNAKKDAGYLASTAYIKLLNGNNIAGFPSSGTEESLSNLSLADVESFYRIHFKPSNGQMIIVSDIDEKIVKESVAAFNGWLGAGPKLDLELVLPDTKPGRIYLVHKDKATQSTIRLGKRSLKRDFTGEYYKNYLMNFPLGGAFNSRINLNLREDKAYTYGASTGFSGDKLSGKFTAGAEVRADVTDKAIVEFTKEIKQYAEDGITAEELAFLRKAINQKDALRYETPNAKLGFLAQILEYDLTPEFVKTRAKIVDTISAEEINALAKKHLNLDDMIIVVVGDSIVLKPQLEALGYTVENYEI